MINARCQPGVFVPLLFLAKLVELEIDCTILSFQISNQLQREPYKMQSADLAMIKDIPGYKIIMKAVLKHQIQQLVRNSYNYEKFN